MSVHNYFLVADLFRILPWRPGIQPFVFLYLGPETVMPLASILAALVGALLVGWRYLAGYVRKAVKSIGRKTDEDVIDSSEAMDLAAEDSNESDG